MGNFGSTRVIGVRLAAVCRLGMAAIAWVVTMSGCVPANHATEPMVNSTRAYVDAREVLRQLYEGQSATDCVHAIEAMAQVQGEQAGPEYVQALTDSSPGVLFAAAMAIGDTKYAPGKQALLKLAADPKLSKNTLCAVVYALHCLGDDSYTDVLGKLLFNGDKWVRANAAMVMGKMGQASATEPLKWLYADEQDPMVQDQLVVSLAMLGDQKFIMVLEGNAVFPKFLDEQLVSIPTLAKVRTVQSRGRIEELMESNRMAIVRVVAARALAETGYYDGSSYDLCVEAATDPKSVVSKSADRGGSGTTMMLSAVQTNAAMALGYMNKPQAVDLLHTLMMRSQDGAVRAAAAMSVLRLLGPYKAATEARGVKAPGSPPAGAASAPAARAKPAAAPMKMQTAGGKD